MPSILKGTEAFWRNVKFQGSNKMNQKHLLVPKSKEVLNEINNWTCQKDTGQYSSKLPYQKQGKSEKLSLSREAKET